MPILVVYSVREEERDELVLFLLLCLVELLVLCLAEAVLVLLDLHLEVQEGPYHRLMVLQVDLFDLVVQVDLFMVVQVDLLMVLQVELSELV